MVLKEMSDIFKEDGALVFVAPIGSPQEPQCFYIMDELRRAGIKCEMNFAKHDLKAQLKQANKLNANYTIIYGEEEANKKVVLLKDMAKRTQEEIRLTNVVQTLSEKINEKNP